MGKRESADASHLGVGVGVGRELQGLDGEGAADGAERCRGGLSGGDVGERQGLKEGGGGFGPVHPGEGGGEARGELVVGGREGGEQAVDAAVGGDGEGGEDALGGLGRVEEIDQGARGFGRGAGGEEADGRGADALVAVGRGSSQRCGDVGRVEVRERGDGDEPRCRVGRAGRREDDGERAPVFAEAKAEERGALHVGLFRGGGLAEGGEGCVSFHVGQGFHGGYADLAGLVLEERGDGLGGRFPGELSEGLAGVVPDPRVGVGEASLQGVGDPLLGLSLTEGTHGGGARARVFMVGGGEEGLEGAGFVDEGEPVEGAVAEALVGVVDGLDEEIERGGVAEVRDDAEGCAADLRVGGAGGGEGEGFGFGAPERLDGADRRLGNTRVRVGEEREEGGHDGGIADAGEGVAGHAAHNRVEIVEAVEELRRSARAGRDEGQEDAPASAVALLKGLEELSVGVAAEVLQGFGGGVRDGGGRVEEVREEGHRVLGAEPAEDATDARLLAWARARSGLHEAADGGGGGRLAEGAVEDAGCAAALGVALEELAEGGGGEPHEAVARTGEQGRERSDRALVARAAEGSRGLVGVARIVEEAGERGDGARVAAAAEDVDGGEGAEEVSAADRGDQRVDGGPTAHAAEGLDGCDGHVVIGVKRELGEGGDGRGTPSPPEDLCGVGGDGGVGRVGEFEDGGVDERARRGGEGVDGGGDAGLVVAPGAQEIAEGRGRGVAEPNYGGDDQAPHGPTGIGEGIEERGDVGVLGLGEALDPLGSLPFGRRDRGGKASACHSCSAVVFGMSSVAAPASAEASVVRALA